MILMAIDRTATMVGRGAFLIDHPEPVNLADGVGLLEHLFEEHYSSLVGTARLLVDDRGLAEEIVQEAFVRFHTSFRRLRDPSRAAGYLRRTVVNLARGQPRRRIIARRFAAASRTGCPCAMSLIPPWTTRSFAPRTQSSRRALISSVRWP